MNKWVLATRPWSFPASATPAFIAFAYVFWMSHSGMLLSNIDWMAGLWAVFGAVLFQIAGNLISDYYDFRRGVDRKDTFGSSRMLVDGVFPPRTIWMFGVVILAVGVLLGLVLVMRCGSQLLWIGIIGVLAAYFYYILKYHALGDLLIFVIYGQLIALGTTYVMTSVIDWHILAVSAPIGFLIVNILHANNTRDIRDDSKAGIRTQAMLLGLQGSKIEYIVLSVAAYVTVMVLTVVQLLPPLSLIVVITLPMMIKNIRLISQAKLESPEVIRDLDAASAQLVLAFGLLLTLAMIVSLLF
ncbi:MAG: 1,4-dihydroxy-2-naphthoate octaprenyltransferase [Parabacteroides sp.]|jgi:1,4-dihydroxy-2-naphthoate octaprenyltransferase|nr:1,4-dihydroxy-2-naphthoate octaprenyltransferase [Parabacteroides sp.]